MREAQGWGKAKGFPSQQGDPLCGQKRDELRGWVGKLTCNTFVTASESGATLCVGSLRVHAELKAGRKKGVEGGEKKGEHRVLRGGAVIVVVGRRKR